jgi:autoinducer 2-degrading protein
MITVLARFKMQPGKESEALETLRDMATAVEASEPGALVYAMHRGQVDPLEIYTYEVYADHAAFAAHRKTPPHGGAPVEVLPPHGPRLLQCGAAGASRWVHAATDLVPASHNLHPQRAAHLAGELPPLLGVRPALVALVRGDRHPLLLRP